MAINPLIIGASYAALNKGYATNININTIRPFIAAAKSGAETVDDIDFGAVLVRTSALKSYKSAENMAAASITDANQVVGICESTNVKLNTSYPGSNNTVAYKAGEAGNNMEIGEIAVDYQNDAPSVENSPVYIVTNEGNLASTIRGKLSASNSAVDGETYLLLPQFRWTGYADSASGLAVVKKLY